MEQAKPAYSNRVSRAGDYDSRQRQLMRGERWKAFVVFSLVFVGSVIAADLSVSLLRLDDPRICMRLANFTAKFAYDSTLGWIHLPEVAGTWDGAPLPQVMRQPTNAQGFRYPHDYERRRNGKARVALLGDSQVFGFYVGDDDYLSVALERARPNTEAYNFGIPGYGPVQELLLLENTVLEYSPDVVILVAFLDNDLLDVRTPYAYGFAPRPYLAKAGADWRIANLPVPVPLSNRSNRRRNVYLRPNERIFRLSALARLSSYRAAQYDGLASFIFASGLGSAERVRITRAERAGKEHFPGYRLATGRPPVCTLASRCPKGERLVGLGAALDAWTEMAETCRRRGIRFVVMISPAYIELHERALGMSTAVAAALRGASVETIELGQELIGDAEPALAFARGGHWSEATTRRAAAEIAVRISESRK